ncbi:hypothetical protein [Mycobacterium sp.]|uniref:hypothetical protein n=1 Tax=Mycobacterium sp. TaxID=1785 RepID=UPI0031DA24D2
MTGIISVPKVNDKLRVSYEYIDETTGLVEWKIENLTDKSISCVLYRNGYYFGDAFFPIYIQNLGTDFIQKFEYTSGEINSMELQLIILNGFKPIVCFVFNILPKKSVNFLEDGFVDGIVPSNYRAYELSQENISKTVREYSIQYPQSEVTDYDHQTESTTKGYSPNPKTFKTYTFDLTSELKFPDNQMFPITIERIRHNPEKENLEQKFEAAIEKGDIILALKYFFEYLKTL